MSVRLNGSGDKLVADNGTTYSVGTGDFSLGVWAKIINDLNAVSYIIAHTDEATVAASINTQSDGLTLEGGLAAANATLAEATSGTWYWLVLDRSGTTLRARAFDDSTSTTPIISATDTSSTSLADADKVVIGDVGGNWFDGEATNAKLHVGVSWTDTQARDEALYYGNRTAGGTSYCWKLKDTGADTDGLYDDGGSGPNMSNTGCVDGASNPTNLSEPTSSYIPRSMLLGVG